MMCFVRPRVIRMFVVYVFSLEALFPGHPAAGREKLAALGSYVIAQEQSAAGGQVDAEAMVETALLHEFAGPVIGIGPQPGTDWTRGASDPNTAFNSKTGQNAVYDKDKHQWIDAKTGKPLSRSAGNLTTHAASAAPAPSNTPETAPPEKNKTVSVSTPSQPVPPKPLVSMEVGGGVGFNNIGGTSGDRAAFLNSFPGGTFSTSANTFSGNVGSSIGIGPAVFDFNAWRANGSDSKGSGPVLGGGTDTASINQQSQGFSVTAGPKIPLGGNVSLIFRGGGNFWHVNIDTKETVANGMTSNTA